MYFSTVIYFLSLLSVRFGCEIWSLRGGDREVNMFLTFGYWCGGVNGCAFVEGMLGVQVGV